MPNSRYIRLQELVFDSFILNAPVEIEKGALLLDSQSKAVLLQLKLNILVEDKSTISSVRLKIFGYDDAGNELEEFSPYSYGTYRDIYLNPAPTFGEKTPILLNHKVRKVKVELDQVVYRDGNVWTTSEKEIKLPSLSTINQLDGELREQLKREIVNFTPDQKERIVYFPQQFENFWVCTCGRPNSNLYTSCRRCGLNKDLVFNIVSEEKIKQKLNVYNNGKNISENKKQKNKRKLISLTILITSLILLLIILMLIPTIRYNVASIALDLKYYDISIRLFSSLNDFNDSSSMINEASYQKAMSLIQGKKYYEARNILSSIGNYKDSSQILSQYAWHVTGGMTKTNYQKYEYFQSVITVSGGAPGEFIMVDAYCLLPGDTISGLVFSSAGNAMLYDGESYTFSCRYDDYPVLSNFETGTMVINTYYPDYEKAAEYEFTIIN